MTRYEHKFWTETNCTPCTLELDESRVKAGGMICYFIGRWMQGRGFDQIIVETETDLSSVGVPILHLIDANENEKVVVQVAFSRCFQRRKHSKCHFSYWTWRYEKPHQTLRSGNYERKEDVTNICKIVGSGTKFCPAKGKTFKNV